MMNWLAEATAGSGSGLSPEVVGTILGAVIAALVGGGFLGKRVGKTEGKAEAMQIGPQPFMVELKEAFVTRREFDRLEGIVAVNASRVEGMFRETMKEVKEQNTALGKTVTRQGERLSQEIKDVATGAYLGRQKIHTTVNSNAERLAKIEERADVAGEIGKMSEVIVDALTTLKTKS